MNSRHLEQFSCAMSAIGKRDIRRIYLSACGGSLAIMSPFKYIFDRESSIPVHVINAKELVCLHPAGLDKNSLFIACSHHGTTPETLAATALAKKSGALVVVLSNEEGSPLWELGDYTIHYDWGFTSEIDVSDTNYAVLLRIAFSMLMNGDKSDFFRREIDALDRLTAVLADSRELYVDRAHAFGRAARRDKVIYTLGAGITYGQAYAFTTCLLMEMLWVHSNPINAAEFFHGPFEVVDDDVTFLALKGIGESRVIDERALTFVNRFTERVHVVDAAEFVWGDIDQELREYLTPPVMVGVTRMYADQLADASGHPLSVRRYMWRMEY